MLVLEEQPLLFSPQDSFFFRLWSPATHDSSVSLCLPSRPFSSAGSLLCLQEWESCSGNLSLPSSVGKFDEVYDALAGAHPNLTVYKKEDIPERWHYKHSDRVQPIVAVADEGWHILQNKSDDFLCEYVIVFLPILHRFLLTWRLWIIQQFTC